MSPQHSTEAIVLRTIPYGEADLVVHCLARGLGKVGAFARGARKSSRRFGGGLEPFTRFQAELQERAGADLFDLKRIDVIDAYAGLRKDLHAMAHAGYATELCRELLHDREPHDSLLDSLFSFLRILETDGARSLTLRAFELTALSAAGLAPQLTRCARCGKEAPAEARAHFDTAHGGVLCTPCSDSGTPWMAAGVRQLLVTLQRGGIEQARSLNEKTLPAEAARRALCDFIDCHVSHDLRSRAFLQDVGAPL